MTLNDLGRPRRGLVILCALVAALWIAAGTSFEAKKITIKTQVDERFSFEGLHAWTWSPDGTGQVKMATTANADPEALRQRVDPVIVPTVEQELSKRGFTKSADTPDLIVNYYVLVTVGQSSQYMGQFVGSIPQWGLPPFEGSTTALRAFPVGTLLIDMVSPKEKSVVWRGVAQAELDLERPPDERRQRLEQAVREVLAKFPPKPKKK